MIKTQLQQAKTSKKSAEIPHLTPQTLFEVLRYLSADWRAWTTGAEAIALAKACAVVLLVKFA